MTRHQDAAADRRGDGRFRGMDGLRAIAACSVLVYHVGLYGLAGGGTDVLAVDNAFPHLAAGVLLFFTLSGLLLYAPFAAALVGAKPFPNVVTFGRNRVLRIVPAYWVVLLVSGIVLGVAVVPDPTSVLTTGSLLDHPRALLDNLLLVQGYRPSTLLTGIGPAWTLAVEVAFYAALPLVCWGTHRVAARRHVAVVFVPPAVFLATGVAGKLLTASALDGAAGWERTWPSVLARSFVANADLFAAGMALAAVIALAEAGRLRVPRWCGPVAAALATIAAVAALNVPGGAFGVFRYDCLGALAAAFGVAAVLLGDGRASRGITAFLDHRVPTAIGLASYSVYLWHQPVIDWLRERGVFPFTGVRGLVGGSMLVGAVTGALAAVTYLAVERPALRKKRPVQRADDQPGEPASHAAALR